MSDELKSALELALEKLDAQEGMTVPTLTEDQKQEIAEIRSKYQARIAETEIDFQGKMRKAVQAGDPSVLEELREKLNTEKQRLTAEMESAVRRVHDGS